MSIKQNYLAKTKKYYDEYGKYILINNAKTYIKSDGNTFPLYIHLTEKHRDILWNMLKDEFYILQNKTYDLMKGIIYEEKTVGYTALNFYKDNLIMELCYILPKYRNKGLFCKEIDIVQKNLHEKVWLDLPNRFAIESLINNNLAVKINEDFVKSSIPLSFRHPINQDLRISTNYYDLRICGSVQLRNYLISPLLDVDIYYFNADVIRENLLNENYFKEIKTNFL